MKMYYFNKKAKGKEHINATDCDYVGEGWEIGVNT